MIRKLLSILASIVVFAAWSQQPQKPSSVEIFQQIQKLNFLGTVLYVAAHPDDENTRLISYFANEKKARTAYLSLTRGDGGQNLIGPELRELLGVIRTQELIEARKIDGGEQFFTRANDFGYSKTPTETLAIWDKDKVLSDIVRIIRLYHPDVIINRFDHRTPGTTHGHHTASAVLSLEAFDKASDRNSFPDQLVKLGIWQPKRIYFNTNWWFYGSRENFEKADKSNLTKLSTGVFYRMFGKSNQEIAALSRSRHQSQGFGSTGARGEEFEYLELLKGDKTVSSNLFEGIDTSWNRIEGGKKIGDIASNLEKNFNFSNPSASLPDLIRIYQQLLELPDSEYWKAIKIKEVKQLITACSGLYLEAVSLSPQSNPGATVKLKLEAINRSDLPIELLSVSLPNSKKTPFNTPLPNNKASLFDVEITLPENTAYTTPYWLTLQGTEGMYTVQNEDNIGKPDSERELNAVFNLKIMGTEIPYERTIVYKYNDDVLGEVYKPFAIVPSVTNSFTDNVIVFTSDVAKNVAVKIKAGSDAVKGKVALQAPSNWQIQPKEISFTIAKNGEEFTAQFTVTPPKDNQVGELKSIVSVFGTTVDTKLVEIKYPHIAQQTVLLSAKAKIIRSDIKIKHTKIAYIMGAGDEVPHGLEQLGCQVTLLKPEEISLAKLNEFEVVITGVRAYNVASGLALKQQILLDWVKNGNTMIVQYNTSDDLVTTQIAPYPLKISRDRVTEEKAQVRFLNPQHPILTTPNAISEADFTGWKQEQGLYYPSEWDPAFTPLISSNDSGEKPKDGAILAAQYGKGYYIYTGLSFFRELPEGVTGAYRLIANMISYGK